MKLSLSGQKWEVKGYWPYVPVKEKSMETGQLLHGVTDWIAAKVPGGVHYDLWKAGLIEDPWFGKNSLHCEWVENRWWMYRTTFPAVMEGCSLRSKKWYLVFQGLDYEAEIFFNDENCGTHKGMYDSFCVDLTGKLKEENKLVVLLKGVPREMGQIGYTSRTSTQKSRFNYKWDFSTRLVNIGIWQDVILKTQAEAALQDLYVDTDYADGRGILHVKAEITDERERKERPLCVRLNVYDPDYGRGENNSPSLTKTISLTDSFLNETLAVKEPSLWYPNGIGAQPLYRVEVELCEEADESSTILDCRTIRTGVRSFSMEQNERAHENALPYTFVINGRKIYIKGVNILPLDHIYGNVTREQYAHLVDAIVNAGVNLVRVWGGGLIEREDFYELCDENGILIWQEFIQSRSGIDNKPCEDAAFLELLKNAAIAAVKEKRNHVSLTVYSGGNELMETHNSPCGLENKNIAMLQEIVTGYDGHRAFLPTSASGPREFVTQEKGVSHDVHGNWRYEGNPDHYVLYGESDNLFHSEFGMDGTCSVKSLQKFLPESSLRPTPMSGDADWQHHGEWWGTYFRDCSLFGPIEKTPDNLERFTRCSQYVQAEGLRFILEADRRRAYQNSGVIIWQLNEPWPNASCTNLVDYYGETKTAYYQMKRAYEARHISLDYRTLCLKAGETAAFPVYVSNSLKAFRAIAAVYVRNSAGQFLYEEKLSVDAAENQSTKVGEVRFPVPEEDLIFVTAILEADHTLLSENTYVFGTEEKEVFASLFKQKTQIEILSVNFTELPENRRSAVVTVKNTGKRAALDAGCELIGNQYYLLGKDNDRILFPQEERTFMFTLIPKHAGTFLEKENYDGTEEPAFKTHWL